MSIPVISPIEITLGTPEETKLLPPPATPLFVEADYTADYTVEETVSNAVPFSATDTDTDTYIPYVDDELWREPLTALDDIERIVRVIAYPEPEWWQKRLAVIREQLERARPPADGREEGQD